MSDHMQPEITSKMRGWQVETRDAGTCFLPGTVISTYDWLAVGKPIEKDPDGDASTQGQIFELLASVLADYIDGRHVESIEVCEGYFARLSAPGYLDCTEWSCYPTIKEARESLRD